MKTRRNALLKQKFPLSSLVYRYLFRLVFGRSSIRIFNRGNVSKHSSAPLANAATVPRICHNRFLPNPFQFII
jgi:hypothetical protein